MTRTITFIVTVLTFITAALGQPDTWSRLNDLGASTPGVTPMPRAFASSFEISGKIYVCAGATDVFAPGAPVFNELWEYDPITDAWSQKAPLPAAARYFAAGFAVNGKGYVAGGRTGQGAGQSLNDLWEYDPIANTWTQRASMPTSNGRSEAGVFVIDGVGYLAGGAEGQILVNTLLRYDPVTDTWSTRAPMPQGSGRQSPASFVLGQRGFVCGGFDGGARTNRLFEYDPVSNTWAERASLPSAGIAWPSGCALNGQGHVMNGVSDAGYLNEHWSYDPSTNSWLQQAIVPGPPRFGGMVVEQGGAIYAGLGWANHPITGFDVSSDLFRYDGGTGTWSTRTGMGDAGRAGASSFSIGTKGYLVGGTGPGYLQDLWQYDAQTGAWSQQAGLPGPARAQAVAFALSGIGYVGTGISATGRLNDLWAYDPGSNSWTARASLPAAARSGASAFTVGNKAYVGTGFGTSLLNDLWEYDPAVNSWTQKAALPGGARTLAAAFGVGSLGFVGAGTNGIGLNDLWAYDPGSNSWSQRSDVPGPARYAAAAIGIGNRGYIAAGVTDNDALLSDLWTYNPYTNTWAQRAVFPGGGRYLAAAFTANGELFLGAGWRGARSTDLWSYERLLLPDCNGDPDGTAFVDPCTVCVGGNTGLTACATAPVNDECTDAIAIPINVPGSGCVQQLLATIGNATNSNVPLGTCTGTPDDDVWFKWTATAPSYTINVSNVLPATPLAAQLFSGGCQGLQSLQCATSFPFTPTGLVPGQEYRLRIYSQGAEPTLASFNVCLTVANSGAGTCGAAIALPDAPILGRVLQCNWPGANLLGTFNVNAECGQATNFYKNGSEALYVFTPSATGMYRVRFYGQSNSAVYVYENACPASGGVCKGSSVVSGGQANLAVSMTAGTPYFIWFDISQGTVCPGAFDVELLQPPSNDECASALPLQVNTSQSCTLLNPVTLNGATNSGVPLGSCTGTANDDVWFSFTALAPQHTIFTTSITQLSGPPTTILGQLFSGECGSLTSLTCFALNGFGATLGGLSIGQDYLVRIYSNGSVPVLVDLNVCMRGIAPPGNDLCTAAQAVPVNTGMDCDQKVFGDFSGSSPSSPVPACDNYMESDLWFSFVATASAHVITVGDRSDPTGLLRAEIFSGTCAAEVGLQCRLLTSSEGYDLAAVGLVPGSTYLVRLARYFSSFTTFSICVRTPSLTNDECASATSLPVNPDQSCSLITTGSTTGATNSGVATTCGGTPVDDVWYSFTAQAVRHLITIERAPGGGPCLRADLRQGECGSTVNLQCSLSNQCSLIQMQTPDLVPGQTYLLRIYNSSSTLPVVSSFSICIGTPESTPPPNDECAQAVPLSPSPEGTCATVVSGTIAGATSSGIPATPCFGITNDDVWYSFVATSTAHRVNLTVTDQLPGTMRVQVFQGECGSLVHYACGATGTDLLGLVPGSTYFIRVYMDGSFPTAKTFDICVTTLSVPANDDCPNAITLVPSVGLVCQSPQAGSVHLASASNAPAVTLCTGTPNDDVWYRFTATSSEHWLRVNPSGFNARAVVYSGGCGSLTEVQCLFFVEVSGGTAFQQLSALVPGQTYRVRVFSQGSTALNANATFTICIGTPLPITNGTCAVATPLTPNPDLSCANQVAGTINGASESGLPLGGGCSGAAYDVWYSFTATSMRHVIRTSAGMNFELRSSCSTGSTIQCGALDPNSNGNTATTVGLVPGETYFLRIYRNVPVSIDFSICIGTVVNDLCGGALPLACGSTTPGTLFGASTGDSPVFCGAPLFSGPGVWYSVVGTGTTMTASTCGSSSNLDTRLAVFQGGCGSLVCVAGNDNDLQGGPSCAVNGTPRYSTVEWNSTAGTVYRIYVTSGNSTITSVASGSFNLSISCSCPVLQANVGDLCDAGQGIGSGLINSQCECIAQALDCTGVFGGSAFIDDCGNCVGGNTGLSACIADCNGVLGGTASFDDCGACSGGTTGITPNSTCVQDCAGVWNGTASVDECGNCTGGNTGQNPCVQDCNGVWGGTASLDDCDICAGGNTGIDPCVIDCNGVLNGTAYLDNCGTCVGGNTGLSPCVFGCPATYTVTITTCGFFDESSFALRNLDNVNVISGSSPGTYTFIATGSGNGIGPFRFFIETIGSFNDNCASYSVSCPTGVLLTGTITGGLSFTSDPLCCPAPEPDCAGVPGGSALPGAACDDGDVCTIGDVLDQQCNCVGTLVDTDNDGVADCSDGCPNDPDKTEPGDCGCGTPDVATTWYADTDADGFGDPNAPLAGSTCLQPQGYVANNTDCNDGNAAVNPGSTEIACNGIDDDCNGVVDGGSAANPTPSEGDYRTVGSGDWSTTEIWERYDGSAYVAAPAPPGSGDGVIVLRDGHTVNITDVREADQVVVESCGSLQLQSGQLTVANGPDEDVLVLGSFQLSGGSLFGPGDITVSASGSFIWTGGGVRTTAVLNLAQGSNSVFGFGGIGFLGNSGTINNAGTFTMTSGRLLIGEAGPGAFNNLTTGVLNFNGANNSENSWEQNTTNDGVINKNIEAPFGMHGTFVNNGAVNVAADELYIAATTNNNGTMTFAGAGTTLRTGGEFTNAATGVIANPATLRVGGGTFTSQSGASISGVDFLDIIGPTTLASGSTCNSPSTLSVSSEFNYAMPFTVNTLNLAGAGQLRGPGAITIPSGGSFTWTGGNLQVNAVLHLEQGSNSVLNFGGFGFVGNNGTINNAGTFTQANGQVIIGEPGPGAFNNLSTGLLTFQGGGFWTQNLTNEGIIACDLAGTFDLNGTFVNNGAVNVATGELGIGATTTNNGTMTFAGAGTTLRTGGEFTNTATGVITDAATLHISGGTFTSQSGASISGVDILDIAGVTDLQSGSTCTSPNAITVSAGHLNHAMPLTVNALNLIGSGQLRGPGAITVPSGGGFTWTGGAVMTNAIVNLDQGSNSVFSFGGFPFLVNDGTINNAGTFTRSVGQLIIQNAGPGAFNNLPTGVLTFNGGGFWSQNITNEGIIDNDLSGNFDLNGNFNNLSGGLVNVNTGSLNITGPQTLDGKFMVAAGALLNSGQPFNFTGTEVENYGSITAQDLRFQGSDAQQLTGTGSITNMTLNGSGGVDLGGTQTIIGALTLTNGTLRLGANDLVLSNAAAGAISGGSASSHVVTNGTGSLRRPVSGAGYVFPVGTDGSYTPATLSLTDGPSEEFRVRMQPGVSTEYGAPGEATGSSVTNDVVGRTWVIEEITPGGNTVDLTLQWNADNEGPGFDRTNSLVAAYDGSNWVSGAAGPASGSGPYSRQTTGVIAFREFTVSDVDAELNAAPTVALALRMVLEGPYDPAAGLMDDALRTLPSFPLTEPYSGMGYGFVGGGGETVTPAQLAVVGPDAIVDWVVVEVRDAVTGIPVLASRSALLQRDGDVVDVDGTPSLSFSLPPGLYQVAVLHRNHLAAMTKVPVSLGALTPVDFSLTTMETFGIQGQKHVSGTFPVQALWAGDVTFDGVIKYTGENNDRDPVLSAIGGIVPTATITGYHGTDVNMDGTVKYTGEENDRDPILQNIGGVVPTNVRVEQVP